MAIRQVRRVPVSTTTSLAVERQADLPHRAKAQPERPPNSPPTTSSPRETT